MKVGPAEGKVELTATQPIPRIEFAFSGAPGYVKQTIEITGTAESKNAGAFLYDATFRARDVGRLTFELIPNPPDATEPSQARVRLATASGGEDSNASYNPRLWFGPGKEATRLVLSVTEPSGQAPPKAGEEILLAEIVATPQGPEAKPIRLAWKVQFSDNPAAPRLKAKRVERP